jgi:N-acetylglucosaminyldiphosphoundecaprenol N-acetyl-beta-D-mannosaminyltransferase
MIDQGVHSVLGIQVHAVDYDEAVRRILDAAKNRKPCSTSALAVHGVMTGVMDPEHAARLNALDLVVPDGQPVRWALNWLHKTTLTDRVYGPTLTLKVCEAAANEGLPIFLYGSTANVLEAFRRNLSIRFPKLHIAGLQPSQFRCLSEEEVQVAAETIRNSGARLVLVGLGCPRQEVWAYEMRDHLHIPILAVGAAFDFHAGSLPQAPHWMQKAGLEWFFRLYQEPRRLWRRYLILNPIFITRLLLQKFFRKVPVNALRSERPAPKRYG